MQRHKILAKQNTEFPHQTKPLNNPMSQMDRLIGPLTESERMEKVRRYLNKKRNKLNMKKFTYKCRKQVAEKRLRIKGRFVTREQAFEILGLTKDELINNEEIQTMLTQHGEKEIQVNSLV